MIGNNKEGPKKRFNGWCHREHIYGILVRTSRGKFEPVRNEKLEEEEEI